MKIAKYLILELLFILLIINTYGLFVDMDKADLICIDVGITNYFHWFRADLNQFCRFEEKSLFMYFWFIFTYYTLLKIITIHSFPAGCKLRFLILEMIIFVLSFGARVLNEQFIITTESIKNLASGLLYMFYPFILYMFFIYAICRLIIRYKDIISSGLTKRSIGISLFILSLFIFPPVLTILYCIILFPFICYFIYVRLPQLFIKLLTINKNINRKHFGRKLVLSIVLALSCLASELFFFRTFYRELSGFWVFAYYILFSAIIRLSYYMSTLSIWFPKKLAG